VRNQSPVAVEMRFDGFNGAPDESVSLAPGGAFELAVQPGDYRLRVVARGGASDGARAVFVKQKRYAFVIDGTRSGEAGRMSIHLREPAVDGGGQ
jgi:hypothetical protein